MTLLESAFPDFFDGFGQHDRCQIVKTTESSVKFPDFASVLKCYGGNGVKFVDGAMVFKQIEIGSDFHVFSYHKFQAVGGFCV